MALPRRAFLLGGHVTPFLGKKHPDFIWKGHPDFGTRDNPTLEETITAAVRGALEATGVAAADVDRIWIGNFVGELFSNQGHLGAAVVGAHPDLLHKPALRVEGACASGGLAFASALDAVAAGADVCLVVGAEVQTTASARQGGDYLARASHYARQRPLDDFTFPALFAQRAREVYGRTETTEDDTARVSVKAYANAHRNPLAHMQAVPLSFEDARRAGDHNPAFLGNEALRPYLKVSDCSQVSDGGAALVVVSEAGLARMGLTPADAIEVVGLGVATGNLYADGDPLALDTTAVAAARAYAQAGLSAADVGVAEVHDCFAVTEILMYEALGFAPRGQGAHLVREGRTAIEGDLPVNTGGGLIGFGHPVGATGVKQLVELVRQLRGEAGDYQVGHAPTVALAANMGGDDKTAVVSLLRAGG
ncbi:MAG: thiolase domain-containing protein [Alphaproteobacteria bacterium]|nr:thiolase domain-containing protein [Alphaproteobacteria bacterium]